MHSYKSQAPAWTRQPKRAGVGSSIKAAESGNCNLIDSWTWFPDAENGRLGPNVWGNPKLAQALSKGGWNPWRSGGYLTGFTWRAAQLRGPRPERRNRGTGTGQPIFWKLPFLAPLSFHHVPPHTPVRPPTWLLKPASGLTKKGGLAWNLPSPRLCFNGLRG